MALWSSVSSSTLNVRSTVSTDSRAALSRGSDSNGRYFSADPINCHGRRLGVDRMDQTSMCVLPIFFILNPSPGLIPGGARC